MSRIGKKPITVPAGVTVAVAGRKVTVKGPKGQNEHTFPEGVNIAVAGNQVSVTRDSDEKEHRAFHGMTRALIANMVQGVKEPWSKTLEIHGTGYRASIAGKDLELDVGFSNKVRLPIPAGLEVKADEKARPVIVTITGVDKQRVGQLAAEIRKIRPPTPYSDNKGVRYRGETIRKKAGKAFGEKK